jgi:hypothetical protein
MITTKSIKLEIIFMDVNSFYSIAAHLSNAINLLSIKLLINLKKLLDLYSNLHNILSIGKQNIKFIFHNKYLLRLKFYY